MSSERQYGYLRLNRPQIRLRKGNTMDPKLLKEREAFKKRALAQPTVEKRKNREDDNRASKKPKPPQRPPEPPSSQFSYKSLPGSSQYKFGVLAKIVKYMKLKHQKGYTYALTIDEILDETNQLDIGSRIKHWLSSEALLNNPKIDVVEGYKFKFKPNYTIKDKKALLRLLDKQDQRGLGGIYQDDVEEALPRCDKALKNLGDAIVYVTRPQDKKKVLFYNDKSYQFSVDEELVKLWRAATVEGVDENKIEDHLEKQGITSMQDAGPRKVVPNLKRKKMKGKRRPVKSHNEHMGDVLQDYSDMQK